MVKKPSIILVIFISVLVSFATGRWGLTESSEARYAQISKEMYVSGDYIHPTLLGIYHFHKPPLTYYITALGYALFGMNETAARFFLMVALLVQLLLVYKISKAFYKDGHIAMAAMLIYFSYPIVQAAAKNLTTDAYLTSFILGAIWFFTCFKQQHRIIYLYLFYLLCGLAFLTKGPVGLMPQGLFAIWYQRAHPAERSAGFHHYTALLLGLLVCFSWFGMLVADNPSLFHYFVKHQLVDRVASDVFSRTQPWWYYLLMVPLLGLPAFIYFADYLRTVMRSRKTGVTNSGVLLLSLCISLLVFSLSSSKLTLYVLPLYLFIAMLSAMHLANMGERSRKVAEKISLWYCLLLFPGMILACSLDIPIYVPMTSTILLAVTGLVSSLLIYFNVWSAPFLKGPLLNALVMIILGTALPLIMTKNEIKLNSIKPMAAFINQHNNNAGNKPILVYDYLLPSLAFYTSNKIVTLDNGNPHAKREVQFEDAAKHCKDSYIKISGAEGNERLKWILKAPPGFLVTRINNDLPDSLSFVIQQLPNKMIFENKWILYY